MNKVFCAEFCMQGKAKLNRPEIFADPLPQVQKTAQLSDSVNNGVLKNKNFKSLNETVYFKIPE